MPKITFLEKIGKTYRYLAEGFEPIAMNTLRKKISYCLSVYAVDEIDFYENDSVIVDEMLANRIALVPLSTPEESTGKKVTLSLEKDGPATVYSGDLKSNDDEVKPIYDTIPLTKLKDNQRIRLDAYAIQGQGRTHVKYSPAIVAFKQLPEFEILRGCDGCNLCVDACPIKCMKLTSGKPKMEDQAKCINCQACVDVCPKNCLKLNDTDNYILSIELIGQLPIESIVKLLDRYTKEYFMLLKKKFK
ncbi:MAG: DNA-directed RNA polymerase subunit D [archaeon]|jgi:DNA-directed RNA polymerase subunit D